MPTLVHQSEWGIVEIGSIWSLSSSPSYSESSGPERPLRVSFTLEKYTLQSSKPLQFCVRVFLRATAVGKIKDNGFSQNK